jgi:sugar-specific transcriptional regulator TrmB
VKLQKILEDIGLTEKESAIYLALLEFQEALPSTLSAKTKVKRPTTYVVLAELQKRGLVSQFKKGGNTYYRALDPNILLESEHDRYKRLEEAMPELLSLSEKFKVKPQSMLFEGKEGIIKIYEDSLRSKTEILGWADAELVPGAYLEDYYPIYEKKKIQRKISSRVILNYNSIGVEVKKNAVEKNREVYLVPKDKYPFKNEVDIYEDKIAIISHEDQVGIIIQNQNIAETQRSIFNFAFDLVKRLEKEILTKEDFKYIYDK